MKRFIGLTVLIFALWSSMAVLATEPRSDVVDPRPRREQVLALTGGVRPATPGRLYSINTLSSSAPLTATWTAYDHYQRSDYDVSFNLRYTSTHAYYYVDQTESVPQSILENVAAQFEANHATVIDEFGHPPDVDSNPRIFILLTDIRDEYTYNAAATSFIPCFFDPLHEHPAQPNSNGREMLYLDISPTLPYSGQAGRCLTHQLTLMAAYGYDPLEEYWLDEGLATLAEFAAGYGHRPEILDYLADPNRSLTGWDGSQGDIGQSYLWALYLRGRFGQAKVKSFFQSPAHGLSGIEPVVGTPANTLFHEWLLANYLDDEIQAGGVFSYSELDIVTSGADNINTFTRPAVHNTVTVADNEEKSITGSLTGYYAGRYIKFERSSGSQITIQDLATFGQSTVINGQAVAVNWPTEMPNVAFGPGDEGVLVVALARNTGSTSYTYKIGTNYNYYWFPLIFKN